MDFKAGYPDGLAADKSFSETVELPVHARELLKPSTPEGPAIDRATFEILIFKPQGRQTGGVSVGDMRDYLRMFGNVSIYDAGFRIPYYGASQDWLEVAEDQGRRLMTSHAASITSQNRLALSLGSAGARSHIWGRKRSTRTMSVRYWRRASLNLATGCRYSQAATASRTTRPTDSSAALSDSPWIYMRIVFDCSGFKRPTQRNHPPGFSIAPLLLLTSTRPGFRNRCIRRSGAKSWLAQRRHGMRKRTSIGAPCCWHPLRPPASPCSR